MNATNYEGVARFKFALVGTNPTLCDTDGDGLWDGDEVVVDTDPINPSHDSTSSPWRRTLATWLCGGRVGNRPCRFCSASRA